MKKYTKEQTIKLMKDFIQKHKLKITLEEIEVIIYNATSHKPLLELWMMLCEDAWIELEQVNIDLITNCWNNFPHKHLWWKAPSELFKP